jgi:NUMOD3 motif.
MEYNVYALSIDGSTYRYVGATKYQDVTKRATQWYASRFQQNTPLAHWIREEADKGNRVIATLLESDCHDQRRYREHWWILELRRRGHDLLNVNGGGNFGYTHPSWNKGRKNGPPSEEVRRKISQSLMGNVPSNKGKPMTEEQKAKLRVRVITDETRARMRASRMAYLEKQGRERAAARDDRRD